MTIPAGLTEADRPRLGLPDGSQRPATDEEWSATVARAAEYAAAQATVARTVTGNQWAFALRDLALAEAWLSAIPKCKASDQWRAGLIGRDTVLRADDPLLARIAANAGSDAGGKALVDPAAVFARALTEPT